jgi:hypothetical protein
MEGAFGNEGALLILGRVCDHAEQSTGFYAVAACRSPEPNDLLEAIVQGP